MKACIHGSVQDTRAVEQESAEREHLGCKTRLLRERQLGLGA